MTEARARAGRNQTGRPVGQCALPLQQRLGGVVTWCHRMRICRGSISGKPALRPSKIRRIPVSPSIRGVVALSRVTAGHFHSRARAPRGISLLWHAPSRAKPHVFRAKGDSARRRRRFSHFSASGCSVQLCAMSIFATSIMRFGRNGIRSSILRANGLGRLCRESSALIGAAIRVIHISRAAIREFFLLC